jgi:hypothetical protein
MYIYVVWPVSTFLFTKYEYKNESTIVWSSLSCDLLVSYIYIYIYGCTAATNWTMSKAVRVPRQVRQGNQMLEVQVGN